MEKELGDCRKNSRDAQTPAVEIDDIYDQIERDTLDITCKPTSEP
jgi:hypothetical protein